VIGREQRVPVRSVSNEMFTMWWKLRICKGLPPLSSLYASARKSAPCGEHMRYDVQCHKCGYITPIMKDGDDAKKSFRDHILAGLCDENYNPEHLYTSRGYRNE